VERAVGTAGAKAGLVAEIVAGYSRARLLLARRAFPQALADLSDAGPPNRRHPIQWQSGGDSEAPWSARSAFSRPTRDALCAVFGCR
jgi:hypothetical protein